MWGKRNERIKIKVLVTCCLGDVHKTKKRRVVGMGKRTGRLHRYVVMKCARFQLLSVSLHGSYILSFKHILGYLVSLDH